MEDQQIIRLFFERSEQAIAELSKAHGSAAARVARNILGSERDAEECVNDTYLAVWNAIPPQKPDPLRTFVCKIARNLAATKYHANTAKKRNSRYDAALDELEGCLAAGGSVEEAYDAKELSEAINAFLSSLSYTDRFLFVRRYWYSDSMQDIAAMTGAFLGCAHERIPAAVDGFISVVAALCAVTLCPEVRDYLFLSHDSYEVGYRLAADRLGLEPCLHLGMRLGEGSGCPLLFRVLEGACGVMAGMATFAQAAIPDDYLDEIRAGDSFTVDKP